MSTDFGKLVSARLESSAHLDLAHHAVRALCSGARNPRQAGEIIGQLLRDDVIGCDLDSETGRQVLNATVDAAAAWIWFATPPQSHARTEDDAGEFLAEFALQLGTTPDGVLMRLTDHTVGLLTRGARFEY
jgi:hypothetical protein